MDFLGFLITECVNALSQAALLFFLGVGLTLIFGIMRIVNFAHGTFYMLGAFIGYSTARLTGNFWLALALALLGGRHCRHRIRAWHRRPQWARRIRREFDRRSSH